MHILTAFLALLSCALIGTGVWLVLRDVRRVAPREPAQAPSGEVRPIASARAGLDVQSAAQSDGPFETPLADIEATAIARPEPSAPLEAGIGPRDGVQASLVSALRAVNGAFAPAGIALVREATPLVEPTALAVALMAQGRAAGTLHVTLDGDTVDMVASSVPGAVEVVRRVRTLKGNEATIPALAEAMAACAWPVVTTAMARRSASR